MVGVGWLYLLTLYFQEVRGFDALRSGLLFAPMTVASLPGAAVADRAALRFGPRVTSTAGLILVAGGVIAMAAAMFHEGGLALLIAGMVVGEAGSMLTSVALTIVATACLDRTHTGLASGLLTPPPNSAAGSAWPSWPRWWPPPGPVPQSAQRPSAPGSSPAWSWSRRRCSS
jgi:MFS family permease